MSSCREPEATGIALVADNVGCNQATVVNWRKRFIERGLDGLADDPRPGPPRSISDDDVEAVIVRTLEDKPTDATLNEPQIAPSCTPPTATLWLRATTRSRYSVVRRAPYR